MKITLTIDEDEVPVVPRGITVSLFPIEDDKVIAGEPVRTVALSMDEDGFRGPLDLPTKGGL